MDAADHERVVLLEGITRARPGTSARPACLRVDKPKRWIECAAAAGFALGSGYGDLKPTTIRVANFPAVSIDETSRLVAPLLPDAVASGSSGWISNVDSTFSSAEATRSAHASRRPGGRRATRRSHLDRPS